MEVTTPQRTETQQTQNRERMWAHLKKLGNGVSGKNTREWMNLGICNMSRFNHFREKSLFGSSFKHT